MPEYKSKLTGPTRGVGAALPQNQAISGSLDPEMAAKLAGLGPAELQKALDQMEAQSAKTDSLRQELAAEEAAGRFSPPKPLELASFDEMLEWKETLSREAEEKEQQEAEDDTNIMGMSIGLDHPLYNPITDTARRKRIESRVSEMDFDEMVFVGYCDQTVPIRKNFNVVFRTLPTQHGLWIEIMLADAREASEHYLRHWFSLIQLAASIQSINGKPVGTDLSAFITEAHRDDFIKAVKKRLEYLGKLPSAITDDLIVNYTWFCGRVRKLLSDDVTEKVGN